MANELTFPHGLHITLKASLANIAKGTAEQDLLAPQGNALLFVVPTGYKFHPVLISVRSNADLAAGKITVVVTDNGTEQTNSCEAVLSDTVQQAAGVSRVGIAPIVADHAVGMSAVGDGDLDPETADIDAFLVGVLLPE